MNAGQIQTTRMGSWDLVAKPSPITRGSQSNFHCGLPGFGPSLSKSREMRRVGCEGIQAKIPLAICNQPLQISQSYFLSISQNTARRNIYLAINMRNTSGAEPMQILLKVFSRSQEGRGTASDTGLKGTESAFQVLQVQDADKCHSALHVVRPGDWFTLIDLKDPYFHISFTHFTLNSCNW